MVRLDPVIDKNETPQIVSHLFEGLDKAHEELLSEHVVSMPHAARGDENHDLLPVRLRPFGLGRSRRLPAPFSRADDPVNRSFLGKRDIEPLVLEEPSDVLAWPARCPTETSMADG